MRASPEVGGSRVVSILISVLFPAPLGPIRPNIDPGATENVRRLTATSEPYFRVRSITSMAFEPVDCSIVLAILAWILFVCQEKRP